MAKRDKKKATVPFRQKFLDMKKVLPHLLRGSSMNLSEMNLAISGSMDPDREMLRWVSMEDLEAAIPKLRKSHCFGMPIIFGTGGEMSSAEYF